MEPEIKLDTIVLNSTLEYSSSEFSNLLTVIHDKSLEKYGVMDPNSGDKAEQVQTAALRFASIYLAISSELTNVLGFDKNKESEVINIISCYVACQGTMQLSQPQSGSATLENKVVARKNPDYRSIDLTLTDKLVVDEVLKSYCNFMTTGPKSSDLTSESNYFFYGLSNLLIDLAFMGSSAKYKDLLEKLVVKGPGFMVTGMKKTSPKKTDEGQFVDGEAQFKKGLKIIRLTDKNRAYRNQIVGNEEAISSMEAAVRTLMAYRKNDLANPYLNGSSRKGLTQALLFLGDTGTGKTLVARYGMTLTEAKAKRYGKDFAVAKFDITSTFQEGGVKMIQHQLDQVCSGDKIYFVFIDEIDTLIASRNDASPNSHYQGQKLGELLRFLDGDYPNLGNYLIVATTNKPDKVDRALKDARFERIYCPGPLTAEQKAKTVALHFGDDISSGGVQVQNWRLIGEYAHRLGLNGRHIEKVVNNCYQRVRQISDAQEDEINSAPTMQGARALISKYTPVITQQMIIQEMVNYSKKDEGEQKTRASFG